MAVKQLDIEVAELESVIESLDTLFEAGDDCIHPLTGKVVSDSEYDIIRQKLYDLNPRSYIFNDVTASKLVTHNKKVTHNPPMVSISKAIGTLDERTDLLKDFAGKVQNELGTQESEEKILVQAYKRDGVAVSLVYKKGKLVAAGLRPRNGTEGEDVTENIKHVEGVQTELWEHDREGKRTKRLEVDCVIRGEIECKKSVFRRVVEDWNDPKYDLASVPKNPRNYAAGSIRQFSNPEITKARKLNFTGYSILNWSDAANTPVPFKTEIERAKYSNAVLRVPFVQVRLFRWQDLQTLEDLSPQMDYEVDGIVISVNNLEDAEQMGTHGNTPTGNPKAKIAWKFTEQSAVVDVDEIIWTPGRSGKLTPVLRFRTPVVLDGTTVSQCTGHSLGFLDGSSTASLGELPKWSDVRIIKSGKIIPKVVEIVRKGFGKLDIPKVCPSCGGDLEIVQGEDGRNLVCNAEFCGCRATARLVHFLSTIGVKGISDAIVTRLLNEELVKYPNDFYDLTISKLEAIGYSKRQSLLIIARLYLHTDPAHQTDEQLDDFIAKAYTKKLSVSAWQLFASLGIPSAGKTAGQALVAHFGNFDAIYKSTLEQLEAVEGLGTKTATIIYNFFGDYEEVIDSLLKVIEPKGKIVGKLSGQTFVFTGGFEEGGKSTWEQKVLALGGVISGSVGKNTNFVVVGTDAGTKSQKADDLGIAKLTLEDLKKILS